MYKLVYMNWYIFYTNSHKRTVLYQFVYMNWYLRFVDKNNKKMLSPKKGDSPLTPGMWEPVQSIPKKLRRVQKRT